MTRYAGFWIRSLALLFDLLIIAVITVVAIGPFALMAGFMMGGKVPLDRAQDTLETVAPVVALVAGWLYCAVGESSRFQGTVGKYALGLKVVDPAGARIGFLRASVRFLARGLSTAALLLGWLMVGVMPRKRALHDLVAGTTVTRSRLAPAN